MKKKSSKNDKWQGIFEERVNHLVNTVEELKEDLKTNFGKVETGFIDLNKCIIEKFTKHNDYHINKEKKYIKYFLIIGALSVGAILSNLSNPENAKFAWSLIIRFAGIF